MKNMETKSSNPIIVKNKSGLFQLIDDSQNTLETKVAERSLQKFMPYFEDVSLRTFKASLTYVQLLSLVEKLNHQLGRKGLPQVLTSQKFQNFVQSKQYYIQEQSEAGLTIKDGDLRWQTEFEQFQRLVSAEISRPLKLQQEKAGFFLTVMKRAANFSVPGAGKTAMMYGTFAYLSSSKVHKVNKLLVVSPLNAFAAWRTEFEEVFGSKRQLHYVNLRDAKYASDIGAVKRDWISADVISINYESLKSKLSLINELIDQETMLVFDEVHRVKGVGGQRAKAALSLSKAPRYRYVLTGTPIPNGFKDVYNFLHLMYPDEYDMFFAWDLSTLNTIDSEKINEKLAPFFWRTNKTDLHVPVPDPDMIEMVDPGLDQQTLAEQIYQNENGALARFVRLLQASTNPELLRYNINYQDLGLTDSDSGEWAEELERLQGNQGNSGISYQQYDLGKIRSPKFEKGIELVTRLVREGKKVLVWAMFVGTIQKISDALNRLGISTIMVYGATPKEDREGMINSFRTGSVQVLVSNPNTLGESISLHQSVHDAVYFEYNFNLTFMLQSRDRINRLGLPDNQYIRYYYLMTKGDVANSGFIDQTVYKRLKDKEATMLAAIDGQLLVPEYTDDYLNEVKSIVMGNH